MNRHVVSTRKARWGKALAAIGLALVGGIIWLLAGSGDSGGPVWDGKPLSAWLKDLNDTDPNHARSATTAVAGVGTNAIPYLIARLSSLGPKQPELQLRIRSYLHLTPRPPSSVAASRTQVVRAFRLLGTNATPALDKLDSLLRGEASIDKDWAVSVAQAMAGVGSGALPLLISGLAHTNTNVRKGALTALLVDFGADAPEAYSAVLPRARDPDAEVRNLAVYFVSRYGNDPALKRDVLKAALDDPDPELRQFAARELAKLPEETRLPP